MSTSEGNKKSTYKNPQASAHEESGSQDEQKKLDTHPKLQPLVIAIIGLLVTILVTALTLLWNKAIAISIAIVLSVIGFIGLLHYLISEKINKKSVGFWVVLILAIVGFVFVVGNQFTHQLYEKWAFTPTATPTLYPTCETITCPTPVLTPCPTIEITPCPMIECPSSTEPSDKPVITTPPWNFNDGCIWSVWDISTHHHLEDNISSYRFDNGDVDCWNLEFFGYTATDGSGLNLKINKYEGNDTLQFGLSRLVPTDLASVTVELEWEEIQYNKYTGEPVEFHFGFLNSDDKQNTKRYFKIYHFYKLAYPNIYREDNNQSENLIGYTTNRATANNPVAKGYLMITCNFESRLNVKCDFSIDENPDKKVEDFPINPIAEWDSIYIGSIIPIGASLNLTITNLSLSIK